jgi:hypothetical protein
MFSKILGKKENTTVNENLLEEKIAKMNLTEMRSFVNNKEEISEEGLIEVLKRLITPHEETSKRYIEIDDMDVKKRKGFELVLTIASHKKITIVAVELIQEFIALYDDVIKKFDQDNKQIYEMKLNESIEKALFNIDEMTNLKRKMDLLS